MGFQQGLSGLNAASKNLDVIGHNIANSNTTGFKASRADFAEMVASAIGSASGQSSGIGVNVAACPSSSGRAHHSTGNNLDIAINGNGFFVVKQSDGSIAYARGNFGWTRRATSRPWTTTMSWAMWWTLRPARSSVACADELSHRAADSRQADHQGECGAEPGCARHVAAGDATATPPIAATPRATYGTSLNVYDTQGTAIPVNLYFEKDATNTWNVYDSSPATATPIGKAVFDASGKLTSVTPNAPTAGTTR
jgi:flagellar hook protein FlgE